MKIIYRGEAVEVEVIADESESDPDMPYLVWFPETHALYDSEGVWLCAADLTLVR